VLASCSLRARHRAIPRPSLRSRPQYRPRRARSASRSAKRRSCPGRTAVRCAPAGSECSCSATSPRVLRRYAPASRSPPPPSSSPSTFSGERPVPLLPPRGPPPKLRSIRWRAAFLLAPTSALQHVRTSAPGADAPLGVNQIPRVVPRAIRGGSSSTGDSCPRLRAARISTALCGRSQAKSFWLNAVIVVKPAARREESVAIRRP